MHRLIMIVFAVLLLPSFALARRQGTDPALQYRTDAGSVNILSGVALNAAEANRTIVLNTNGWAKLRVAVFFTYSSSSQLTAIFRCSFDGTNYARIQSRKISDGASTLSSFTDVKATSSTNQDFIIEYSVKGCVRSKIVFAGTPAGAGDLITVQALAQSEK